MEDIEKAYAELKLENERLRAKVALLQGDTCNEELESRYKALLSRSAEAVANRQQLLQSSLRDKMERKRIEQELLDCRTRLEEKVRERTAQLQEQIHQRAIAENELLRERNLLRTIIDNIPDEIYVKDLDRKFILCNKATLKGLRVENEKQVLGRSDSDFLPPETAAVYKADEEAALRTGTAMLNKEESAVTPEGKRVWFRTTKVPLSDSEGRIAGLIGIGRDITTQKEAEAALREERDILQIMIDNLPDHLYVKDRQHRFTTCNRAVIETDGFSPIGMTDFDIYPREKAEVFYAEEERVMAAGEPLYNKDEDAFYEDGDLKQCCLVNKFPLRDSEGNVVGIVGVNHDITEIKRANRALEEERNVLRTLIDNLPAHVYIKDVESRFVTCNCAVANLYACDPVGKTDFDLYPPEEAQQYYEGEQTVMRTGKALVGREWYAFDEPGAVKSCWSINKFPLRDASGLIYGLVGIDYDVTELKLAERAARESEERFRRLSDLTFESIIIHKDGIILDCNRSCGLMLGYEVDELIGMNVFDFAAKRGLKAARTAVAGESEEAYEQRIVRKDGAELIVEAKGRSLQYKGQKARVVAIRDITAQKAAQDALRESEEQYRSLVENSLDGIVITQEGTVMFANKRAIDMFGYGSMEEMRRISSFELAVPEQRQMIKERARDRCAGKDVPGRYEFTGLRKDGTALDIDICAGLITYKGQKAAQMLMHDVTGRNRLKRELAEYREKILQAEKTAYVSSIGAAVAHQLNQPLTVINLLLEETLSELEGIQCPDTLRNHICDCLAESKNAGDIISRFRTYARDPHFDVCGTVDVHQVLEKVIATLSDNAARAKVKVMIHQKGPSPVIETSMAALEQVSFLLMQNAIQASDGISRHRLDINVEATGGAVEMEFTDDCGGIPPENLDQIFVPFFTTKPAGEGTGLGLTIVQRILLTHGGKVSVESELGRGSTFRVLWPLRKDGQ